MHIASPAALELGQRFWVHMERKLRLRRLFHARGYLERDAHQSHGSCF
jgi:hypothetical protein